MNWDAIGTIAEIISAFAVVISLLYLALQVRQNAAISRSSSFLAVFDGLSAHNNYMFGPQNVELVIRCLRNYPNVSVNERMQFDNLMTNLFNYLEASYEAAEAQSLGEETMESWEWWFETKIFPYQGAREWWADGQPTFPPYIRSWIDQRIAAANPKTDYWGLIESSPEETVQ
jgi:hypothetical protein